MISMILLFFVGACNSGSDQEPSEQDPNKSASTSTTCPVELDISTWETFESLGNRLHAGQQVPFEELEDFANQPVMTIWRESMTESPPPAEKIAQWLQSSFWDVIGNGKKEKRNSDRTTFGKAYRFNYDNRQEINRLLTRFDEQDHPCQVFELASRWLDQDKLPDPFVLSFLPSKSELRTHEGNILVDTSILLAGGVKQLDRQLVALIYRDRQAFKGVNPLDVQGSLSVANTLRIMMNEGVASWIEDMPNTHFRPVHPRLSKVLIIPEDIFRVGIRTMAIFDSMLPPMIKDQSKLQKNAQHFTRSIAGAGAFTQGGYCMAAVIANQLGEDKLIQVRNSPPAFLEAFQQAASKNTLPLPVPGAIGRELYETMPPLSEQTYAGLLQILEEAFPRQN